MPGFTHSPTWLSHAGSHGDAGFGRGRLLIASCELPRKEQCLQYIGVYSSGPVQESGSWSWVGVHNFCTLWLVVRYSNTAFFSDHVVEFFSIFNMPVQALCSLKQSEQQSRREVVISSRETWGQEGLQGCVWEVHCINDQKNQKVLSGRGGVCL